MYNSSQPRSFSRSFKILLFSAAVLLGTVPSSVNAGSVLEAVKNRDPEEAARIIAYNTWACVVADVYAVLYSLAFFNNFPVHHAAFKGRTRIVKLQITANHNAMTACDGLGNTAMHAAAEADRAAVATILVNEDPRSAAVQNNAGDTPLHTAARRDNIAVALPLLEADRASLSIKNSFGNSPLHVAAARGSRDMVRFLMKHNASLGIPNAAGHTPQQLAQQAGHNDIAAILQ